MLTQTLFLVLIGCVIVLANPIDREESTDVDLPTESEEINEFDEEQLKEFLDTLKQKVHELLENVDKDMQDKNFQKAFEEIKEVVDEVFGENRDLA